MQFRIFSAPGDHRDDFENVNRQLNEWSAAEKPQIAVLRMTVTAMTDERNVGRYLMTVLVGYRGA